MSAFSLNTIFSELQQQRQHRKCSHRTIWYPTKEDIIRSVFGIHATIYRSMKCYSQLQSLAFAVYFLFVSWATRRYQRLNILCIHKSTYCEWLHQASCARAYASTHIYSCPDTLEQFFICFILDFMLFATLENKLNFSSWFSHPGFCSRFVEIVLKEIKVLSKWYSQRGEFEIW